MFQPSGLLWFRRVLSEIWNGSGAMPETSMERCCSRGAIIAETSSVATPYAARLTVAIIGRERGGVGGFPPADVSFGLSPPRAGFSLGVALQQSLRVA